MEKVIGTILGIIAVGLFMLLLSFMLDGSITEYLGGTWGLIVAWLGGGISLGTLISEKL